MCQLRELAGQIHYPSVEERGRTNDEGEGQGGGWEQIDISFVLKPVSR